MLALAQLLAIYIKILGFSLYYLLTHLSMFQTHNVGSIIPIPWGLLTEKSSPCAKNTIIIVVGDSRTKTTGL